MLAVRDISVKYGPAEVICGVSFELRKGLILVLLGPNGAGKTTLIRTLNGSVPLAVGEVNLDEQLLSQLSRRDIAKSIAVVAQENETKFPVSVLEFVLAGRFVHGRAFGWESEADIQAARTALKECDLSEFEARLMNELSGGERQRVVLARAIATEARVLLLDEPTANLDLAHQALMFRLIRERCRKGAASVVITHGHAMEWNPISIHIERMHLEEDAGKNVHEGLPDTDKYSYVDLNRAGTPLAEIVTGPDFRSSWQAYDYVNHVRRVLQWVGASDADMEKGNLRCEANVSVRKIGESGFNNKVELKNLNSVRFMPTPRPA